MLKKDQENQLVKSLTMKGMESQTIHAPFRHRNDRNTAKKLVQQLVGVFFPNAISSLICLLFQFECKKMYRFIQSK